MQYEQQQLNIIEIFASVQGETSLTGLPTTFIRLAACNLRCSWCDTTYSFGRGTPFPLSDLIAKAHSFQCPYVCITGGEPLLQPHVHTLMHTLCDDGFIVSLETSGSLSTEQVDPRVRVILDIKCPGSGMSHKNYWQNLSFLQEHDEVKFVIKDRHDFDYAVNVCQEYGLFKRAKEVLFSPVFEDLESRQLVEWILEHKLPARLNLQVHKYIWSPTQKGV